MSGGEPAECGCIGTNPRSGAGREWGQREVEGNSGPRVWEESDSELASEDRESMCRRIDHGGLIVLLKGNEEREGFLVRVV